MDWISLSHSLFLSFVPSMEKISSRRHRRFLVLSLSFLSGHSLGSDGSLLFLSRAKKKKRKKKLSLLAKCCGPTSTARDKPLFSFRKKKKSTRALSKELHNTKMAFVAGGISTLRISAANHVRPKGAKESRKNRPVKHRPSDKNRAPTNYPTVDPASIPPVYTVVSEAKKA